MWNNSIFWQLGPLLGDTFNQPCYQTFMLADHGCLRIGLWPLIRFGKWARHNPILNIKWDQGIKARCITVRCYGDQIRTKSKVFVVHCMPLALQVRYSNEAFSFECQYYDHHPDWLLSGTLSLLLRICSKTDLKYFVVKLLAALCLSIRLKAFLIWCKKLPPPLVWLEMHHK